MAYFRTCVFLAHTKSSVCEAVLLHLVNTPSGRQSPYGHHGRGRESWKITWSDSTYIQWLEPSHVTQLLGKLERKHTGAYAWHREYLQLCFNLL